MSDETDKLKSCQKVVSQLFSQREERMADWKLLARYILPSRGLFPGTEGSQALTMKERNRGIVNRYATRAVERAAAGFTSGMTPEALKWVEWGLGNPALESAPGVRPWLDLVQDAVYRLLKVTGFYQAIHMGNTEIMAFACLLIFCDSSVENIARFQSCTVGTYAVAKNGEGELDTVARVVQMTPHELESRFGKERLSTTALSLLKAEPYKPINIIHLVRPRKSYDPDKLDAKNMPWESVFYEAEGASDILHEGGYHEMPYFFASWNEALSIYGSGPGDDALPDVMQLQEVETQELTAIEKMVSPPLRVPTSMKQRVKTYADAQNKFAANVDPNGVGALYNLNFQLDPLRAKAIELRQRIDDTLLASVFADMPLELRPSDMSATEYMERKRERLQIMGPLLASYEPDVLMPILTRCYGLLSRAGVIPPPPEILRISEGSTVNFTFRGPLAQSMQSDKANAVRSFLSDIMNIAQVDPKALMKVNTMNAVDELAKGAGVPGRVVRSDEEVAALEQAQAEQQAAMQEQAMGQQTVDNMIALGKVPAGEGSMMQALQQQVGGE